MSTTVQDVAYSVPLFTPESQMRVTYSCGHTRAYLIADYEGPSPKRGDTAQCADCSKAEIAFPTIDSRPGGSDREPS